MNVESLARSPLGPSDIKCCILRTPKLVFVGRADCRTVRETANTKWKEESLILPGNTTRHNTS